MKRLAILLVAALCFSPLSGCEWLDAKPTEFQSGVDAAQKIEDAAEAEIARLQAEADALRAKQDKSAGDIAMLDRVDKALAKARETEAAAQELLDDWQARLDAAPTNGALLENAAGTYANLLFPGGAVIVALAGGWLRSWRQTKLAVEQRQSIVSNIDAAKSTEVRGSAGKIEAATLDIKKLAELNEAAGVTAVVDADRKAGA